MQMTEQHNKTMKSTRITQEEESKRLEEEIKQLS